jgi:hypothetical protein
MSVITNGYNALLARLEALYPAGDGWVRLPNAYRPEENPDTFLKQGYALALGAGQNTNRQLNCAMSVSRTITVILARLYTALKEDAAQKAVAELQLFEDQKKLIVDLETEVTVNGSTMYTRYIGDGGIEYVQGTTERFLMVRTEIQLEYFEPLA